MKTISRRQFIKSGILTLAWASQHRLLGGMTTAFAGSTDSASSDGLLVIFLRGGCDGLNFLTPINDSDYGIYSAARPNLKLNITGKDALLKLDDHFGLHPSAGALTDLFKQKNLAFIHAVGLKGGNRSHFDSQLRMEQGSGPKFSVSSGWIGRYITSLGDIGHSDLPGMTVGPLLDQSLYGLPTATALENPGRFDLTGPKAVQAEMRSALRKIYASSDNDPLHFTGKAILSSIDKFETFNPKDLNSSDKGKYPDGELGQRLRAASWLFKNLPTLKVVTVSMGGWDTHRYQGSGGEGRFAQLVGQLSQGMYAFSDEFAKTSRKPPTIIVMTEFGRRLKENANRGTDHGHGSFMMALGADVKGGRIYGTWPGLATDSLFERADLQITTDYRDVISEILMKQTPKIRPSEVFPGLMSGQQLGLMS